MEPYKGREYPEHKACNRDENALIFERRFSNAIIDSILGVFYVLDVHGNFVRDNQYHQAVLGYSADEILKMNALDTIAEEDRGLIAAKIREVFEKGFTTVSARILTRDGRKIPYLFTGYPAEIEGKPYLIGMGVDISERVKAEEALKASENLYRAIFNNTGAATIIIAEDSTITLANSGWVKLTCIPREEQENKIKWQRFFEAEEAERMMRLHVARRSDSSAVPEKYECKLIDARGKAHYCIAQVDVIPGTTSSVASLVDITDRKQAEIALRESEEKFRVLADTSPAAIIVYQGERVRYVNDNAAKLSGYTKEELMRRKFWEGVHPDYRDLTRERGFARQRGENVPQAYEIKTIGKKGEVHWDLLSAGMVVYEGAPAVIVTLLDITDRKRAEEALEDAKNQAELFLDLMGHDISNMNQIGVGYLEMAQEIMDLDDTSRELIRKPLETLYDSSRLIADVNKLQRISTSEIKLEKTNVGRKLQEVAEDCRGMPGVKTIIRNRLSGDCLAMANEMLYDVFASIIWDCIRNAEGDHTIDLSLFRDKKEKNGNCVIFIDSHGSGLSDEQKVSLFERPRRGMKRTGGRGIGLYLAKTIVDRFGGALRVEDLESGDYKKGTRFIITLQACGS